MIKKEDIIIRKIDMPADVEKLVEMWKVSDEQWPGTLSGGVEITPQWVIEMHEREKMLDVYVAETADRRKIVGFCSMNEREAEKNTGYLAVLNVQPDYQGKSIGRRLVQRCVERCTELGFHMLSIHTWPGNLKSVPMYKKCGYFWVPDSSVYMLNFIPPIRQLPCAQPYFSRHDWYATFKRALTQDEDDERWEGMKVFTYHWEEEGEVLTVWADREAHRVTAVETNTFFASAVADDIEPAKGLSTTMRWRVTNKGEQPMSVSLVASGTEHIKVESRATFEVAPGETQELDATVDIALDTPEVKPDKPVPYVRTLLIIDGEVLELGTGMRPRRAIEVSTAPEHVTLFPGVAKTVHIQLQSQLKDDVEATVSLTPTPGLDTDWTEQTVAIPAKSFAAIPIVVQSDTGGVYPLLTTIYFEGGQTKPEHLPIFNLPAGGVLAYKALDDSPHPGETRLENEWTRLVIKPRAGETSLISTQTNNSLAVFRERVGPPFWPNELDEKTFNVALKRDIGRVTAILTAALDDKPGITLWRELTLGGGPLVSINDSLGNKGVEPQTLQISHRIRVLQDDLVTGTYPLAQGIVQSHNSEFPSAEEDISKKAKSFAERWITYSSERGTLGLLWDDTIEEQEIAWGVGLISQEHTCAPQQWTPGSKLYLYVGPGDWRTVRAHARRLTGADSVPTPIPAQSRKVYGVYLEPTPLLTVDDKVEAQLIVDNLRGRVMEGQVNLTMPEAVSANDETFKVEGISVKNPLTEALTLMFPAEAMAYEATATLETHTFDRDIALPMIRLGTRATVDVEQTNGTFIIDNGRARFDIAPDFSGALVRWEEDGVNHTLSAYPEQVPFDWISPWYGGITPVAIRSGAWDFPGKLDREAFTGTKVDVLDAQDIPWRGVRVGCDLQRERMLGLRVEVDYLTVGESNVLKLIYRVRNMTTAERHIGIGWLSFWQPDGESQHNTLHAEGLQRKPNNWQAWAETRYWSSVTNKETGRTLLQVSPYPNARYIDWGSGGHLAWVADVNVSPEGVLEREVYLALSPTLEDAKRYIALKEYK